MKLAIDLAEAYIAVRDIEVKQHAHATRHDGMRGVADELDAQTARNMARQRLLVAEHAYRAGVGK